MLLPSEMSDAALLRMLDEKGIRLSVREGRLSVNAPSGVVSETLRAELGRRKLSLLQLLQGGQPQLERTIPRLQAHDVNVKIPQTPAQQGMWLLNHFNPNDIAYNIPQAFLMSSALDISRLQYAVDALTERHDALRMSFYQEGGKLFLHVSSNIRSTVSYFDLSDLPETQRKQRASKLLQEYARTPFDLSVAPLIRFYVVRLGVLGDVLFVNIHHIIADRGSIAILREDLLELYSGVPDAMQTSRAYDDAQYAEYALWAAEQLKGTAILQQKEYWKKKLEGVPPYLPLPHSKVSPTVRTSNGAVMPLHVDATIVNALTNVGQKFGATPFMVFLSSFAVLLSQLSGTRDFCIGTPITHRKQVELERTIGLFANTIPLRCRPEPTMRFVDVLEQVRTTALEAFENSDVPFQSVLRVLRPARRAGQSPIFQVLFIFDSFVSMRNEADQTSIDFQVGTARYDLTLHLTELRDGALTGMFEYCTDIFTESDIELFAKGFYGLLPLLGARPQEPLKSVLSIM